MRPSKTRSPEVRFLMYDAAELQGLGDFVGAALRVNVLVTLCPRDHAIAQWLVTLRRRIDAEHEQNRALREEASRTVLLSARTVRDLIEGARAPVRPRRAPDGLEGSLDGLDFERDDLEDSVTFSGGGVANSLLLP